MNPKPENPSRLETAILAISFLMLWAWYLARQSAFRAGMAPSPWLHLPLVFVVLALAWVFIRRLKRVVRAMREQKIGIGKKR